MDLVKDIFESGTMRFATGMPIVLAVLMIWKWKIEPERVLICIGLWAAASLYYVVRIGGTQLVVYYVAGNFSAATYCACHIYLNRHKEKEDGGGDKKE